MPWSTRFYEPIVLPDGRKLVTLRDAATYVTRLPKADQQLEEWQAAAEVLMLVARSGDPMLARIAMMRALNRNVVREFTSGKDRPWGKRKLRRDQ